MEQRLYLLQCENGQRRCVRVVWMIWMEKVRRKTGSTKYVWIVMDDGHYGGQQWTNNNNKKSDIAISFHQIFHKEFNENHKKLKILRMKHFPLLTLNIILWSFVKIFGFGGIVAMMCFLLVVFTPIFVQLFSLSLFYYQFVKSLV
jgi:hypothetical protein